MTWHTILDFMADFFIRHGGELLCFGSAAFVGLLVAMVELLSRYGAGNRPDWVLRGEPQRLYYLINALFAGGVFWGFEALGKTQIAKGYETEPSAALLKAAFIGLTAMFALRSSLFSIPGKGADHKVDVGLAQILNVLNQYLDRQIDKKRSEEAINEIAEVMKDITPEDMYPDILLCLLASESLPKEKATELRTSLEAIVSNQDGWIHSASKSVAMGLCIQKELGSKSIRTVIAFLKTLQAKKQLSGQKNEGISEKSEAASKSQSSNEWKNKLELINGDLEAALEKLDLSGKR